MSQTEAQALCLDKIDASIERRHLTIEGRVQGVGFRPFVYNLAKALDLTGWVANGPEGVGIEVQGKKTAIRAFLRDVQADAPTAARIDHIHQQTSNLLDETSFAIRPSLLEGDPRPLDLVDRVTCTACLADICDPGNRRFRYPFTTCTACGPRYSIFDALPYDRARTAIVRLRNVRRLSDGIREPERPALSRRDPGLSRLRSVAVVSGT